MPASQAGRRGFESRLPLHYIIKSQANVSAPGAAAVKPSCSGYGPWTLDFGPLAARQAPFPEAFGLPVLHRGAAVRFRVLTLTLLF